MPIYIPRYSPKFNPFGEAEDVTPADLETEFSSYKLKSQGRWRIWAFQGASSNPRDFSLFYSESGGNDWDRNDFTFPDDIDTSRAFIESTFMDNELWFLAPLEGLYNGQTSNVRLDVYKSTNNGNTWSKQYQLEETDWYFTGNPAGYRIFPCTKGVYVVGHMGNTIADPNESKIAVWKDGVKDDEWTVPNDSLFGGLINSFYSNKYEMGYFDLNRFPGNGGQHIYKFDNGTITKMSETPSESDRPLFQDMFFIPEKDFLMVTTQALTGARVYYSFDGGATLNEQLGAGRIQSYNFTALDRQKLVKDLSTGDVYRSEAYIDDLNPGALWNDVLTGLNAPDFDYSFPTWLRRRGSDTLLWKIP